MTATITTPTPQPRTRSLDLDALAAMTVAELTALYRGGDVPADLAVLDGKPTCRMLTSVGPLGRGPAATAIRRFARSGAFPWAGKSFAASTADEGTGINRVRLPGGIKRTWFPFATTMGRSAIDDEPCILLDYDRDDNPWVVRKIRDELRQVAPKLFLGPAMLITPTKPRLLMYFALQA